MTPQPEDNPMAAMMKNMGIDPFELAKAFLPAEKIIPATKVRLNIKDGWLYIAVQIPQREPQP